MARQFDEVAFDLPIKIAWSDLSSAWRASTTIGGEDVYGATSSNPVGAMTNLFAQLVHNSDDLLAGMERKVREADKSRRVLELDAPESAKEAAPTEATKAKA
jgi:hypothetical protein